MLPPHFKKTLKSKVRATKKKTTPNKYKDWVDARGRFHLSNAHIQMARELGMNPRKFGMLATHKQERWKSPLPEYIEELYFKRFHKERPDEVKSIEQLVKDRTRKKEEDKVNSFCKT